MDTISIIGLGYVGLPLALMLSKKYTVIGYDVNKIRINSLCNNIDSNLQFTKKKLSSFKNITYTHDDSLIKGSSIFIVTVPTPVKKKKPDLYFLTRATETVAKYLSKKSIVVYESTVYPGITENFCGNILSKVSKLKYKKDFFLAYSPERINPGDKKRTIDKITKVIGASDKKTLKKICKIYQSFLGNNIYKATSIAVAEAAKVIENSQRDINIAFMNEIKNIFDKGGIDIYEILDAAKTKWNFLNFEPGLVGGHCIGVDPFYLAEYAKQNNIKPRVILSGRFTNENEVNNLKNKVLNSLNKYKKPKIIVLGCTFKENCPDIRNSKVVDLIHKLEKKNISIDIFDNWINNDDKKYVNANFVDKIPYRKNYNLILIAVKHDLFKNIGMNRIKKISKFNNTLVMDYKKIF